MSVDLRVMKARSKPLKKATPSRREWQNHWSQLFDTGERDAAINAVVNAFYWLQDDEDTDRRGWHDANGFASILQNLAVEPLTQYISDIESRGVRGLTEGQEAALKLIRAINDVCEAMTRFQLLPARVEMLVNDLRLKWDAFIMAGAAYRMYHDVPIELARKERNADGGRRGAQQRRKIDMGELQRKIASYSSRTSLDPRGINSLLATHFMVTPSAIRKARKKLIENETQLK